MTNNEHEFWMPLFAVAVCSISHNILRRGLESKLYFQYPRTGQPLCLLPCQLTCVCIWLIILIQPPTGCVDLFKLYHTLSQIYWYPLFVLRHSKLKGFSSSANFQLAPHLGFFCFLSRYLLPWPHCCCCSWYPLCLCTLCYGVLPHSVGAAFWFGLSVWIPYLGSRRGPVFSDFTFNCFATAMLRFNNTWICWVYFLGCVAAGTDTHDCLNSLPFVLSGGPSWRLHLLFLLLHFPCCVYEHDVTLVLGWWHSVGILAWWGVDHYWWGPQHLSLIGGGLLCLAPLWPSWKGDYFTLQVPSCVADICCFC